MTWLDVAKMLLPAALTVIGALLLTYLSDLRRRSHEIQAAANLVGVELNQFKVTVAKDYVSRDDFIRCLSGLDGRLERGIEQITKELASQRTELTAQRQELAGQRSDLAGQRATLEAISTQLAQVTAS